jgi:hypothetical protein
MPQMRARQTLWTSDPTYQLLALITRGPNLVFIISTKIFFNLDTFEGMTREIPWEYWGPSNTRVFDKHDETSLIAITGTRVLQTFTIGPGDKWYELRIMDFSPLAVKHQGLGLLVKEPSIVELQSGKKFTTCLPYIEVVAGKKYAELVSIWVDPDRIYLLSLQWPAVVGSFHFYEF